MPNDFLSVDVPDLVVVASAKYSLEPSAHSVHYAMLEYAERRVNDDDDGNDDDDNE